VKIWVKICGITRARDAALAIDAGADAIGINFYPSSTRYCGEIEAKEILAEVAGRATVYGLFVNERRSVVEGIVSATGVTGVQFHGAESDGELQGWHLPVLRAIRVESRSIVEAALRSAPSPWRLLLDSPHGGGSGTTFDPRLLEGLPLSNVVVAGGLTPDNVAERIRTLSPWGVDVSTGVEAKPGIKDPVRVRKFIENAKAA
jgi:phosphoribosylanthranilate isomerase